ncbi:amidohydrolase family protein, partial [Aegicerativicinus sediminis]
MKQPILILLIFIISLVFSCPNGFSQTNNNSSTESRYTGPIIDMHLHAYKEGDPMLGLTHPPTLRGQTFKGSESAKELQTEILKRFEKYNIKKAILTNADFWYTDVPETIINAKTNNLDTIRLLHSQGKLGAIAELAPYYAGILADDPSQEPYFELAEELQIPVGFHILPGGPNNGIHLMPEMLGGMRVNNANPTQLEPVLAKFPKLKLYIMHGGWPYVEDVKALLYAHANV